MQRVLALDPGDRVGWSHAEIHDDGTWTNLEHGITDLKECAMQVLDALEHYRYDLVVIERWALYGHMAKKLVGSEIPSAQFIGMVKLCCWNWHIPYVMQPASRVNCNTPGQLSPAEAQMRRLRPELFDLVMQPVAHDDGHDLVAIKHLFAYTFDNYHMKELT